MTIIEKIFSRAAGRDVKPGDYLWARLNLVAMRDFGGPNVIQEYESCYGTQPVFDPDRVAITFDLHIPARNEKVAENQKILRDFARRQGVRLFDVNTGIGQHILLENGLVKPWDVIVGTDSHMNLLGAVGAAGFGMGTTDIAGAMYKGKLWFQVPETIKIEVSGKFMDFVGAKDLILSIVKELTTSGALNKAIEFSGETVASMNLSERITVTSLVTEMSGDVGFIVPDEQVLDFIRVRTEEPLERISADQDSRYCETYEFSVDDLVPQVACPHSPDNVRDVADVAGVKVDQVFIGSCTNGRHEDLQTAARILNGHRIRDGLRLVVVPATIDVAKEAVRSGVHEIFLASGAVVTNPGCALCTTGHPGILAPGETMVSTSNRNFVGKLGKGANVYLASPATAAATALKGEITDPRSL
ncbi:MAG: aconitase/3-isopropylmalate dehydratase large subunit family protein [candidate division WOR-3 bacterium]|nr:aconitase/3-isopropylmalate dehydratase large subunit family protein [candidate division WOR-3 bacterium]